MEAVRHHRTVRQEVQHRLTSQVDDGSRLSFVLRGRGMRSIIGAGELKFMLLLEKFAQGMGGRKKIPDRIDAVSGSATNAPYYITDQPEGADIYWRYGNLIMNEWQYPQANIDRLVFDIMQTKIPLDMDRLAASVIDLHIYATNRDGTVFDFSGFQKEPKKIFPAMRASASIPGVSGRPYKYNGIELSDGTTAVGGIPFDQALEGNPTHMLVFDLVPKGSYRRRSLLDVYAACFLATKGYGRLAKAVFRGAIKSVETAKKIDRMQDDPSALVQVDVIRIGRHLKKVSTSERNPQKLLTAEQYGFNAAQAWYLGHTLSNATPVRIH